MSKPFNGSNSVVVTYGQSGVGKTVDNLYSFPNALFVANPGALKPAYHVVGHVPASVEARTIMDATKLVQENMKSSRYDAVVVDDFSLLADSTVNVLEQRHTGFKLWGALRDTVLEFRDVARHAGCHVVLNAHESAPKTSNGMFIRGGPKLPGRLPEDLPTACDLVLRAAYDGTRRGWHAVYRCSIDDTQYVEKDRHGICPDKAPMNLAEILRAAGYAISRAPGLEWQEEIVDVLSRALTAEGADESALMEEAVSLCHEKTQNDLHIRWVMRDALDRAALTRAKSNVLSMYLG